MMTYLRNEAAAAHPYKTDASIDYLAWAKQILYREKHGDTSLLPVQLSFARQALGLTDIK